MPLLTETPTPPAGPITAVIPAAPGCTVSIDRISGPVVAWAVIAAASAPGGVRLDPVFVAGGRVWTPDQYRAATGSTAPVTVITR